MKKRKLKLGRILIALALLILIIYGLLNSQVFKIRTVKVVGNDQVGESLILEKSNFDQSQSFVFLDKSAKEEAIEEIYQIKNATISRIGMNAVEILVEERQAKAYLATRDRYLIIDDDGYIFDQASEVPKNLTKISLDLDDPSLGEYIYDYLIDDKKIFLQDFFKRESYEFVDSINMEKKECKIFLDEGIEVRFGPYSNSDYKLAALRSIYSSIKKDGSSRKVQMILMDQGEDPILLYE